MQPLLLYAWFWQSSLKTSSCVTTTAVTTVKSNFDNLTMPQNSFQCNHFCYMLWQNSLKTSSYKTTTTHSELFGLFSFGNWKFENPPISILLSIILLFIPYIFIIQSKKNYRWCETLRKIVLKLGENCFFATFSIVSLVSQGTNLVKTHILATFCRKY